MKSNSKTSENYILLPVSATRVNAEESPKVAKFFTQLQPASAPPSVIALNVRTGRKPSSDEISVRVLDSIDTDGAKLVNINDEELPSFRFSYPGVRIIPERFYTPALSFKAKIKMQVQQVATAKTLTLQISDDDGKGIPNVTAVFFSDFAAGRGASGITNEDGKVILNFSGTTAERIYIYPEHSYWGLFRQNVPLQQEMEIRLKPIKNGHQDSLRFFYPTASWPSIRTKIRIGVIDTGSGPHQDLPITGGKNTVRNEREDEYFDNGEGHGTHVAGIIAAAGKFTGVAAGAEIMSYRVFPKGEGASSFDIIKAIDQAIKDQCDLINMSFGEAQDDEAITSYIKEAYDAGILCFAANGNDNRGNVAFPAAYSLTIAVSAMGRKNSFPPESIQEDAVRQPFGTDDQNFVADFSNIGSETDLTAPGVGIISTYPGNHYAVMDGTSMACPAATGMAARILSGSPQILNLPRNQVRADEMVKYLALYTKVLGFGANFEGKGMLWPDDALYPET